jgi:hypothetical protein
MNQSFAIDIFFFNLLISRTYLIYIDMGSRFKWEYKDTKSFENRLEEAQRIKLIYPDCVPVRVVFLPLNFFVYKIDFTNGLIYNSRLSFRSTRNRHWRTLTVKNTSYLKADRSHFSSTNSVIKWHLLRHRACFWSFKTGSHQTWRPQSAKSTRFVLHWENEQISLEKSDLKLDFH